MVVLQLESGSKELGVLKPWNIHKKMLILLILFRIWCVYHQDVGSIPHAGVVLTTIVHPTMVGGPWTLLYGYLEVLWGDTMSGIFKAPMAS